MLLSISFVLTPKNTLRVCFVRGSWALEWELEGVTPIPTIWLERVRFLFRFQGGWDARIFQNPIRTRIVFKSHSSSDYDSNYEPNASEIMTIPIHSDSGSNFGHESNASRGSST